MNKRGQATQVFLYVIMVLIVGLVLILGYKGIGALLGDIEETGIIEFRGDVQSAVKKGASYGRVSTYDFDTGSDHEKLCFVDRGAFKGSGSLNIGDAPPLIEDSVITSRGTTDIKEDDFNVFVLRGDQIEPILTGPLELDKPGASAGHTSFKCFNLTSGRVSIVFKGDGDSTYVVREKK